MKNILKILAIILITIIGAGVTCGGNFFIASSWVLGNFFQKKIFSIKYNFLFRIHLPIYHGNYYYNKLLVLILDSSAKKISKNNN